MATEPTFSRQAGPHDGLSVWLDLFRWVAAFAVLLTHVHHRVFVAYGDVPRQLRSLAYLAVTVPSSFGVPAVICFFVLSGYLVGGGELARFRVTGAFAARRYWVSRLTRLWVTLIPALILSVILYRFALLHLGGFETGAYPSLPTARYRDDAATFLCNAVFMQMALCPAYVGNGPLWSLFNEAWYYAVWPAVLLALYSARPAHVRVACLLLAAAMLAVLTSIQILGANIGLYFLVWLMGVAAADRERPFVRMSMPAAMAVLIGYLLFVRVMFRPGIPGADTLVQFPLDLGTALLLANLLLVMKDKASLAAPPLAPLHRAMAQMSFSLYCINVPVTEFACALLAHFGIAKGAMLPGTALPYLLFAALVAFNIAIAAIFYMMFERHTLTVRRWCLHRRITPKREAMG